MPHHDEPAGSAVSVARAAGAVRHGRRRRRALGFGLAAVLLIAVVVVEGRSVLFFHTVTPWSSPGRMHVCGRDYSRGDTFTTRAAAEAVAPGTLRPRARGPLWQPIYAGPAPAISGAPCGTVVYLPEGDGYRAYDLVGGP
jgi:hypothetical protein